MKKLQVNEWSELNGKHAGIAYSLSAAAPELLGLLAMLIASAVYMILGLDTRELAKNEIYVWVLVFLNQAAFFLVCAVIFRKYKINFVRDLGVKKKPSAEYAILGVLFTAGLMFFISPIVTLMVEGLEKLGYHSVSTLPSFDKTYNFIIAIFVVGILPAVLEETLFRGVILSGLKNYGWAFAIFVTSLLFVLMHKSVEQTVYQMIFSVALCYVTIKTGSVYVPMLMHLVNNLLVIVLQYAGVYAANAILNWEWIAMAVGGAVVLLIVLYEFVFKKRRIRNEEIRSSEAALPKKVFVTYAAFGIVFNVVMLLVNLFI